MSNAPTPSSDPQAAQTAAGLAEFAAAQGLQVETRSAFGRGAAGLRSFFIKKRLGAAGLVLVVVWSFIAVGTVGGGGGWLGVGRYDSQEVFRIANQNWADAKIADVIAGVHQDITRGELRDIVSDPSIYGQLAIDEGYADAMVEYAAAKALDGTLLSHLLTKEPAEIAIGDDGVIQDVDDLYATGLSTHTALASLHEPSGKHWLGTDRGGHDLFARVTEGARLSLYIGFFATAIAVVAGTVIGLISGGLGGSVDISVNRLMDAIQTFPPIVFLLLLRAVTEPSAIWVTLSLAAIGVAPVQRVVRGSVIQVREQPFVEAARTIGAGNVRILAIHILPNLVAPLIVLFSIYIGLFILAEASLSFLGLGTLDVSWGKMIADGRQFIVYSPWTSLWAGLALTSLVFGFNVLGDALRDTFDPRLRGSR